MGNDEDAMWEAFNTWHRTRYGWCLRDDRERDSQKGYDSQVAWNAWKEATLLARTSNECRMLQPAVGDYVLATKYEDGDPGDMWALGWYDGVQDGQGRHYVKDNEGKQIRGNGFRRVARIRKDVGRWLLEEAAKSLEQSPPGTVSLWTMLTAAAFDVSDERRIA